MSLSAVYIYCELITVNKNPVLFDLHEGVEVPEYQDKQFSGRVQFDKDILREGRVRLHVSRLRTEDSGLYRCSVKTDIGASSGKCRLKVTAAADEPESVKDQPLHWTRTNSSSSSSFTGQTLLHLKVLVLLNLLMCQ
ncbi:butyrophilin subfamily 1 member A1-like [Mastacembelus armatus]|uniref:butyrophilin subfamily 1 member A1-like n=1 Tax=Mastacembelus armatus TaxID=205130 RepID=UPI000E4616E1|nr:butyrophilin subfamily 1 member A1-like [Mastacembelus armatus]